MSGSKCQAGPFLGDTRWFMVKFESRTPCWPCLIFLKLHEIWFPRPPFAGGGGVQERMAAWPFSFILFLTIFSFTEVFSSTVLSSCLLLPSTGTPIVYNSMWNQVQESVDWQSMKPTQTFHCLCALTNALLHKRPTWNNLPHTLQTILGVISDLPIISLTCKWERTCCHMNSGADSSYFIQWPKATWR